MIPWLGIGMLVSVGVITVVTRWAVWEILVSVSVFFSILGVVAGIFNPAVLGLLASRLSGLLENDLLQAIPLYVLFGILLQASGLSHDLFVLLKRICQRLHLPEQTSVLMFSAMVSPMNGSVAANAGLLRKFIVDKEFESKSSGAVALVSASSTVGLVIPPSLVLILMGDTMMRAHTEAINSGLLTTASQQVMNTADMFHVAIVPGMVVFFLWLLVSAWVFRGQAAHHENPVFSLSRKVAIRAWLTIGFITLMLLSVFNGSMYAVEAAATGCLVLSLYTAWQNKLAEAKWIRIVRDTFSFGGSLLSLLIATTTFSLVFQLFETDQWISEWIIHSASGSVQIAIIFAGIAVCAWLMDAFELIFVIIPVVSPGLIIHLGSAEQTAELLLLVIQCSFLIPPFGYAVAIARHSVPQIKTHILVKSLLPYWVVLWMVFGMVLWKPQWMNMGFYPALLG